MQRLIGALPKWPLKSENFPAANSTWRASARRLKLPLAHDLCQAHSEQGRMRVSGLGSPSEEKREKLGFRGGRQGSKL